MFYSLSRYIHIYIYNLLWAWSSSLIMMFIKCTWCRALKYGKRCKKSLNHFPEKFNLMVLCTFFVLILEYYLMIWPLCSITRRVLIMALDCPMYKNVNILVEQFAFLFNLLFVHIIVILLIYTLFFYCCYLRWNPTS